MLFQQGKADRVCPCRSRVCSLPESGYRRTTALHRKLPPQGSASRGRSVRSSTAHFYIPGGIAAWRAASRDLRPEPPYALGISAAELEGFRRSDPPGRTDAERDY